MSRFADALLKKESSDSVIETREDGRFQQIKKALLSSPIYLCPERAMLVTEYFKRHDDASEPMGVRKARAFRYVMEKKSVRIFPDELIVGNVGRHRKSAIMHPELAGVFVSEDLLWIDKRKTTPFQISWADRLRLLTRVIPYWLLRSMPVRAFSPRLGSLARYMVEQLHATGYLINEVAGIGHFLPNYEKMIQLGMEGYLRKIEKEAGEFFKAVRIACEGVLDFAERLGQESQRQAEKESDPVRAAELAETARICRKVPRHPAETFQEALQSLWLTHLAVCLEGINSAVSFGRMDQYLHPYYKNDMEAGRLTPERARELLLCFSAKSTEHVFIMSERTSKYHGGFLVAQAAIVGGLNSSGQDAANDLSYIFLDVMEASGLRDPNYQVRLHAGTPEKFLNRSVDVARKGRGVPAFFNDEATIESLVCHGYPLEEARNYGVVGCVEPSIPGKSFLSTDAALFNLPHCLLLALNRGKSFGSRRLKGAKTPDPTTFHTMDHVLAAFQAQVTYMVARMVNDLQVIEQGNRDYHPTPFSSMLVDGCLESGMDVTAGGACYNSSGVQGVGTADVSDSLAALQDVVYTRKKYTLPQILEGLRTNFASDPKLRAELLSAPKFGNNHEMPDTLAAKTVEIFHAALSRHTSTRGGPYVMGLYSSTTHVAFGEKTGALPSGRRAGKPFAASLGSSNGRDRLGPTALLNSAASIDSRLVANGYALNLRFDPQTLEGEKGVKVLSALVRGFFEKNGMEVQFNVLAPGMLEDARDNPGKHPGLVVRVAGYCAYFDDLPDAVKDEIICRNRLVV